MGLGTAEIERIDALLAALGDGASAALVDAGLRRLLPGVTCRRCDAADVLEAPFRSGPAADLYLLDVSGHCIRVIGDPAQAGGILVAERIGA